MLQNHWFRLMRRIPHLGTKKYFLAASTYITPRKLINIARCEYEAARRVLQPKSFPYIAILDITNVCNLRCPYCPTGIRQDSGRRPAFMTPETVSRILDEIGDYLVMVYLYNWGEPLLNKDIGRIIELCHKRGIFTSLSSNLSLPDCSRTLEALCDAGLDHLDPSIDGATQEVYQIYRKNGDLSQVLNNMRYLSAYRHRMQRSNPVIDWQFLDFPHNRQEIERARTLAREVGADRFFTRHGYTPQDNTADGTRETVPAAGSCNLLYRSIVINADSSIAPCCYMYSSRNDFGNFRQDKIRDIRHNKRYTFARSLFNPRHTRQLPDNLQHPCLNCHKTAFLNLQSQQRKPAATSASENNPGNSNFFYPL